MSWHLTGQLIESCSCNVLPLLVHGTRAPTASRWTDPDLRQFETKSGARGEFTWSA